MSWMNLDDKIGYVMLKPMEVEIFRQVRDGDTFFTAKISHGKNPIDKGYAYAILPNATEEDTANYARDADIEIISSDNRMHAIYDKSTGIIGANVFEPSYINGLNILTPCAILFTYDDGVYNINVADPTLTLNNIRLEFDNDVLVYGPDNILVDGRVVSVHMKKRGAGYNFSVVEQ